MAKEKKNYNLGPRLITVSTVIAFLSFFHTWGKDLENNTTMNGFEVSPPVVWYILIFAYPIYKVFKGDFMNKFAAIIIALNGLFFAFLFIGRANSEDTAAAHGPFVYLGAITLLIIGIILFPKKER
ncbi:hypothetical protein CIB95_02055 [Lottiidibacillus patelloidae]|uniref:Uncharacterized protein n=1 Tax=Lottiidibacillus patelloidae TaxID=2670334 RepID=A0A263BYY0_9BACI|nr:hypothetical protein [Lottiidibacillus patelloidae]OZM58376.1 hypothetical protein CIB95_02055 [Lottiidibacillus patelloidae]